jgi:hypothetical protein
MPAPVQLTDEQRMAKSERKMVSGTRGFASTARRMGVTEKDVIELVTHINTTEITKVFHTPEPAKAPSFNDRLAQARAARGG